MNKIRILVDSTSSLTKEKADELGVTLLPTMFVVEGEEKNPIDPGFTLDEFYAMLYEKKVGTACINQYTFENAFRTYLEQGEDVLFICLSSGLSASYTNAVNAANALNEEFGERVAIIDPLTAGLGMQFFIDEAKLMIADGKSVKEIQSKIDKNGINTSTYFTIGSLDHLYRGGRLNKAEVVIGNALKAKPIVKASEIGSLKIQGIHLGKRKTIKEMADLVLKDVNENYPVQVSYTNNPDEADFLKGKLLEGNPNLDIRYSQIDYTLACHCGPETIAIFYRTK